MPLLWRWKNGPEWIYFCNSKQRSTATSRELRILRDPVREHFCLLHILTFIFPVSILIWSHLRLIFARDLSIKIFLPKCRAHACGMHVRTVRFFFIWSPISAAERTKLMYCPSCRVLNFYSYSAFKSLNLYFSFPATDQPLYRVYTNEWCSFKS